MGIVASSNLHLTDEQLQEAQTRSSVSVHVVHEAVRQEGEEELKRSSAALAWSGLAAGLSMGFSLAGEGLIRSRLPDAPWRPLFAKFGYSAGFALVILGRQQLFTENTLTAILPLLHRPSSHKLNNVLRLWAVVLAANTLGALVIAWVMGNTAAFSAEARAAFQAIGQESLAPGFWTVLLRGIFAGWLLAMLVWILPFAEHARFFVIVGFTWLIGVSGFSHVVAGAIEVLYLAATGSATWGQAVGGYIVPALIGNILGGVSLVAALNHAQVVS
jgi:formate-nitrite transporter family protein